MTLSSLTRKELECLARLVGTSLGYLIQIKYGYRRPSPRLAKKIELAAAQELGLQISRFELLYPDEVREGEAPPDEPLQATTL